MTKLKIFVERDEGYIVGYVLADEKTYLYDGQYYAQFFSRSIAKRKPSVEVE